MPVAAVRALKGVHSQLPEVRHLRQQYGRRALHINSV